MRVRHRSRPEPPPCTRNVVRVGGAIEDVDAARGAAGALEGFPQPRATAQPRPIGHSSLLRWFAFNSRREEVLAAIAFQRTRVKDTEGKVLDFLVRHCDGQQ